MGHFLCFYFYFFFTTHRYIGHVACFAGTTEERTRGKEYLSWLIRQRDAEGGHVRIHIKERDDVTCLVVPQEAMEYVAGEGGKSLRSKVSIFFISHFSFLISLFFFVKYII